MSNNTNEKKRRVLSAVEGILDQAAQCRKTGSITLEICFDQGSISRIHEADVRRKEIPLK